MVVEKQYVCGTDVYRIKPITDPADVLTDYEKVRSLVTDTPEDEYKEDMYESINQGLAFSVWKNDLRVGCEYNTYRDYRYFGECFYMLGRIPMIIGLYEAFQIHDNHKIEFAPHEDTLKYFISAAIGHSIRGWHQGERDAIALVRDDFIPKVELCLQYLGVTHG